MKKLMLTVLSSIFLVTYVLCQSGNAIDFDGTDDYIDISPAIAYSNDFTIMGWMKSTDNSGVIFVWGGPNVNNFASAAIFLGKIRLRIGDGATDNIDGIADIGTNNWTHIAVTKSGSNICLYVNGILDLTATSTKIPTPATSSIGGGFINGIYQEHYQGLLDEISVWNVALTEPQIQGMLYNEVDTSTTGLVAYYQFNQGVSCGVNTTITTLDDASLNGNDGDLMNFDLNGTCLSNWVESDAMKRNSLHFDGTDDRVSSTLPAVFTNIALNDFSIEVWVKPEVAAFNRIMFAQYNSMNFANLSYTSSQNVYFYLNNNGTYAANNVTAGTIPLNQWTHIAATWDASASQIKIYFNGIEQSLTTGGSSSTGTDNMLTIGSRPDGNQYFTGEIDELRIWDKVLDQCNIYAGMNCQMTGTEINLVALYNFNHGIPAGANAGVTSLTDFTGNGYDGTLLNFALAGTISNWLLSDAYITEYFIPSLPDYTSDSLSICDGDSYTFGSQTLTTSGLYTEIFTNIFGCDSIVDLNLTVNPVYNETASLSICEFDTLIFGSQTLFSAGTYTETLQSMYGCDSVVTLTLSLDPLPVVTIQGDTYTCDSTILDEGYGIPGDSYLWSTLETTQTITVYTDGSYSLTVTDANGCKGFDTVIVDIDNIIPVDIGSYIYGCAGYDTLTIDAGSGYDSYLWSTGETSQNIEIWTDSCCYITDYTVTVISGLCESIDTVQIEWVMCSGIDETNFDSQISVYPNPNNGNFNIYLHNSDFMNSTIKIFDNTGKLVFIKEINLLQSEPVISISTERLSDGIYKLYIDNGKNIVRKNLFISE